MGLGGIIEKGPCYHTMSGRTQYPEDITAKKENFNEGSWPTGEKGLYEQGVWAIQVGWRVEYSQGSRGR